MSTDPLENLKQILLRPEQEEIHRLEEQIRRLRRQLNDKAQLIETLKPVISESLSEKIHDSKAEMAKALAPVMGSAIKQQIKDAKDEVIDALYPVIGQTIRRSIAEALKNLAREVNEKLDRALSFRLLRQRIRAKVSGVPAEELVLKEALPFRIHEIFLIHKESGILLQHVSDRQSSPSMDQELISGMLTAIRDFANTAFREDAERNLYEIQYDDLQIRLEIGRYAYLAFVISGVPPQHFEDQVHRLGDRLRSKFAGKLRSFTGDTSQLAGTEKILRTFLNEFTTAESRTTPAGSEEKTSRRGLVYFLVLLVVLSGILGGIFYLPGKIKAHRLTRKIEFLKQQEKLLSEPDISIKVSGQTIYLTGSVANPQQKQEIESLLRRNTGAETIVNNLQVAPAPIPPDKLIEALAKQLPGVARNDLKQLTFHAAGNMLFVEGTVRNDRQKVLIGKALTQLTPYHWIINNLVSRATLFSSLQNAKHEIERIPVYFAKQSAEISAGEKTKLDQILSALKELAFDRLSIIGYSDNTGTAEFNLAISKKRAEAVKSYLIDRGIPADRLVTIGRGMENPVGSTDSEEGRKRSRRVEFSFEGTD